MANLRGGGYIIIGITRTKDGYVRSGITEEHLETYDTDIAIAEINKYASPAVEVILGVLNHRDQRYLVFAIEEFAQTPVICSRDGAWETLDKRVFIGNIYIRPPGLVETRRPKNANELSEVLEIAVEKRALQLVRSRDVLNLAVGAISAQPQPHPRQEYATELGNASSL